MMLELFVVAGVVAGSFECNYVAPGGADPVYVARTIGLGEEAPRTWDGVGRWCRLAVEEVWRGEPRKELASNWIDCSATGYIAIVPPSGKIYGLPINWDAGTGFSGFAYDRAMAMRTVCQSGSVEDLIGFLRDGRLGARAGAVDLAAGGFRQDPEVVSRIGAVLLGLVEKADETEWPEKTTSLRRVFLKYLSWAARRSERPGHEVPWLSRGVRVGVEILRTSAVGRNGFPEPTRHYACRHLGAVLGEPVCNPENTRILPDAVERLRTRHGLAGRENSRPSDQE